MVVGMRKKEADYDIEGRNAGGGQIKSHTV